eukprot:GHVO01014403.1.p1 GENE.GHVO01014403.1~~GHVO01014403.1.p1  ORF type:complete len:150 (+),score=19.11 GHVO01014403.1:3-452(+)
MRTGLIKKTIDQIFWEYLTQTPVSYRMHCMIPYNSAVEIPRVNDTQSSIFNSIHDSPSKWPAYMAVIFRPSISTVSPARMGYILKARLQVGGGDRHPPPRPFGSSRRRGSNIAVGPLSLCIRKIPRKLEGLPIGPNGNGWNRARQGCLL